MVDLDRVLGYEPQWAVGDEFIYVNDEGEDGGIGCDEGDFDGEMGTIKIIHGDTADVKFIGVDGIKRVSTKWFATLDEYKTIVGSNIKPIQVERYRNGDSPYPDHQPDIRGALGEREPLLNRIPPLVNIEGILPEFQEFYNNIVASVLYCNWSDLYDLSDKVLTASQFVNMVGNAWDKHLIEVLAIIPNNAKRLDIELNMEEFRENHRNIIGSFNISTYHITTKLDEFQKDGKELMVTELVKGFGKLWFTYDKQSGFQIITRITPFILEVV